MPAAMALRKESLDRNLDAENCKTVLAVLNDKGDVTFGDSL